MSVRIEILPGTRQGTFTLGYVIEGMKLPDPRFAPFMPWREAKWLWENEQRPGPGRRPGPGDRPGYGDRHEMV